MQLVICYTEYTIAQVTVLLIFYEWITRCSSNVVSCVIRPCRGQVYKPTMLGLP